MTLKNNSDLYLHKLTHTRSTPIVSIRSLFIYFLFFVITAILQAKKIPVLPTLFFLYSLLA